ncbi:MAG: hypothetical protein K8U03_09640 [Planctomycetia bacterium]|nr:hypothetical protein [Planctomycetia bacterium]
MTSLSAVLLAASLSLLGAEPKEWTVEKHLQVAGQPTGKELAKLGDEAYRFVMTDAGLTSSTVVLVYKKGPDYFLKGAEVHLHDYYGSQGKSGVKKIERKLTSEEWTGLQTKLAALDFWNMRDPDPKLVLDGTRWTIEGALGPKQRAVFIASPEKGSFRAVGLDLWAKSGFGMGYLQDRTE